MKVDLKKHRKLDDLDSLKFLLFEQIILLQDIIHSFS